MHNVQLSYIRTLGQTSTELLKCIYKNHSLHVARKLFCSYFDPTSLWKEIAPSPSKHVTCNNVKPRLTNCLWRSGVLARIGLQNKLNSAAAAQVAPLPTGLHVHSYAVVLVEARSFIIFNRRESGRLSKVHSVLTKVVTSLSLSYYSKVAHFT